MGIALGMNEFTRLAALRRLFGAVVLLVLFHAAPAAAGEALRGVALVIGNSEYEHLPPLANPANDARDVERLLSELGFDTELSSDRDARRLSRDLRDFVDDAEGADVAVLYYAGHGIEAGGENFLVPVDADLSALDDAGEKLVPVSEVIDKLRRTVRVAIVLLDACRNNPFPPGATLKLSPDAPPQLVAASGLTVSDTRSATPIAPTSDRGGENPDGLGTVIGFAAEPGKPALDGPDGSNSPYAAALLRHIDAMAGVEFGTVMRMVAEEVYLKTGGRQHPWVNESLRSLLYLGEKPPAETGPEGDILRERRQLLLTIASLPSLERRQVEQVAAAEDVPMDAIYGLLRTLGTDAPKNPDELRKLLEQQTGRLKQILDERATLKSSDAEIKRLSGLADKAIDEGALETALDLLQQAKNRVGELEETVDKAENDIRDRRKEFAEVFAKSAETRALAFDYRGAAEDYDQAYEQIARWDDELAWEYKSSAASRYFDSGKYKGGHGDFLKALDAGRKAVALAGLLPDRSLWGQAQSNLGNTLIQLGRADRKVEYLDEATRAIEAALSVFDKEKDPTSWAVVMTNLGTAYHTIGDVTGDVASFDKAIAQYELAADAYVGDDWLHAWANLQGNIASALMASAADTGDAARMRRGLDTLDTTIAALSPEDEPIDWAWAQFGRGTCYLKLARMENDPTAYEHAIEAFRESLKVRTPEKLPIPWADSVENLASAYQELGQSKGDQKLVEQSIALYRDTLTVRTPEATPVAWARSKSSLADTLRWLGIERKDEAMLEEAVNAAREAEPVQRQYLGEADAANSQAVAARAMLELADIRKDKALYLQAATLARQAFDAASTARPNVDPQFERSVAVNALRKLAASQIGEEAFDEGLRTMEQSSGFVAAADTPGEHALSRVWLGWARQRIGEARHDPAVLLAAADDYSEALRLYGDGASQTDTQFPRDGLTKVLEAAATDLWSAGRQGETAPIYTRLVALYSKAGDTASLAAAQRNLGTVEQTAATTASDKAGLERALAAHKAAEAAYAQTGNEALRLASRFSVGQTLAVLARLEPNASYADEAIATLSDLAARSVAVDGAPDPADIGNELAYAYWNKGYASGDTSQLDSAAAAFRQVLDHLSPDNDAGRAAVRQSLASVLTDLGERRGDAAILREAVDLNRKLLDATSRQDDPVRWAERANGYGYALSLAAGVDGNQQGLPEALSMLSQAASIYEDAGDAVASAQVHDSLCVAAAGLARTTRDRELASRAVSDCETAARLFAENGLSDLDELARRHRDAAVAARDAL